MSDSLSNRLADRLAEYPKADEPQFVPKTEFDGSSGYIQTGPLQEAPAEYSDILRQFGYNPESVRIVGNPRVSRWQQRSRKLEKSEDGERLIKTSEFETVWLEAYRFSIAPTVSTEAPVDVVEAIKQARAIRRQSTGAHWFVFQAGDQQLGKRSRDGSTAEIVDRYVQSVQSAKDEFAALKRHGIDGIQISIPGDCLEGNQSQAGKNLWLTQETITEQTRIFRRLLHYTVEEFAPLAAQIYVDVVNGNHDQAQRVQNTYPGDGWATEQAIAVSDALKLNPLAYGHVEVRVPEKWSGYMTVPVGDTVVTVVHGHQFGRQANAMKWWQEQTFGGHGPAAAHILQNGHFHEFAIEQAGERTRIQSPTFDCGSDWFREKRGVGNTRGALTYLLKSGEISRLSVV